MPFLAAGALIGGLSAGAAAGGMTALTGAALGASVGGMAQGYFDGQSAKKAAANAAANAKVDIAALDNQTREIAKKNAFDAANLEKQLTPEVPQLRTAANNAVLGGIGGNANQESMANFVMSRFGQPITGGGTMNTPLLNEAIAKARADLGLGGQLSLDQRNEATRRGATAAGTVSSGRGLGLGRDLSARDLGMTSYQVEQQRLANAAMFTPQESQNQATMLNYGLQSDIANNQNLMTQYGALNSYYNNLRQQDLAAAQYGQSISQPVVGLDPSAVANISIGNQNNQTQAAMNAANIKAQQGQNLMGFGGQLLGYGLMGGFGGASGAGAGLPQVYPTGTSASATIGPKIFGGY